MDSTQYKKTQFLKVLLFLFLALFVVLSYTFLHEGGHALVGVLSGARLTTFSFIDLNAHIGLDGNLTSPQRVLFNLAGVGLPLLVWLGFILLAPRQSNFTVEGVKVFSTLFVLSTLQAWVALPIMFIFGNAPLSDDVTNFLRNSGLPPLLVSGLALVIFISGWALLYSRIPGVRGELIYFRRSDADLISPSMWKSSGVLAALLLMYVAVGFVATDSAYQSRGANPDTCLPQGTIW
jgi:hypothetical protein